MLENVFFSCVVANKITLLATSYSVCVVYTKTIIHLGVGGSDGYLPPLLSYGLCRLHVQVPLKTLSSLLKFEKCVKYANEMSDDVIHTRHNITSCI